MTVYLGLGSNLGDRRGNLRRALRALDERGIHVRRASPVVESPALLPAAAPSSWNRPYLNLAAACDTEATPSEVRRHCVELETALGRERGERWAPRTIDIDILLWGDEVIQTSELTVPHPDLQHRAFVLSPLIALTPSLELPTHPSKTLLDWSAELALHIPLWMGILNVTPDSFSDGGRYTSWAQVEPRVERMVAAGAHLLDIGGQSTRPGAQAISAAEEWTRIVPVLEPLISKFSGDPLRPLISVDTYHPEVARRALELGVDVINDVGGLTDGAMVELAVSYDADFVAMHQLTLPVDRNVTLPEDCDPVDEVEKWLQTRMAAWTDAGLDLDRIILDPGIGFGKNALQSLELLRRAGELRRHGLRTLVGHSRKSFLKTFTPDDAEERDLATLGASLELCRQGVDILRVHEVERHVSAYRGWAHLRR